MNELTKNAVNLYKMVLDCLEQSLARIKDKAEGAEIEDTIYYMDGNDGTRFDWRENANTCEFCAYNTTGKGVMKGYLTKKGKIIIYFYPNGELTPVSSEEHELMTPEEAVLVAALLEHATPKGLYNCPAEEYIHLDADLDKQKVEAMQ